MLLRIGLVVVLPRKNVLNDYCICVFVDIVFYEGLNRNDSIHIFEVTVSGDKPDIVNVAILPMNFGRARLLRTISIYALSYRDSLDFCSIIEQCLARTRHERQAAPRYRSKLSNTSWDKDESFVHQQNNCFLYSRQLK